MAIGIVVRFMLCEKTECFNHTETLQVLACALDLKRLSHQAYKPLRTYEQRDRTCY